MVDDRMRRYESFYSDTLKFLGIGTLGIAAVLGENVELNETAIAITGGSLLLAGYASDAVAYMRGYFNERLAILERQVKAGDLERKVQP